MPVVKFMNAQLQSSNVASPTSLETFCDLKKEKVALFSTERIPPKMEV